MSVGLIWCDIMRDAVVPILCEIKNVSEKFTKDHANEFRAQDAPRKSLFSNIAVRQAALFFCQFYSLLLSIHLI